MYYKLCLCVIDYIMFVNKGLFKIRFTCICVYVKLKSNHRKIMLLLELLLLLTLCVQKLCLI